MVAKVNGRARVDRVFHFREAFMFVSHAVWLDVIDGKLKGNALRVLSFIASNVDMRNRFTGTQAFMAEELGMSPQSVNRSFGELVELGYVFRVRERNGLRVVLLDAKRMYRGAAVRHASTVERQAKDRKSDVQALRASDDALRAWENNRGEPVPA